MLTNVHMSHVTLDGTHFITAEKRSPSTHDQQQNKLNYKTLLDECSYV